MAAPPHVAGRTLGGGSPGALLPLGQVANDRAADGLRRYFSQVEDFDVEVDLLGLRSEGGRTIPGSFAATGSGIRAAGWSREGGRADARGAPLRAGTRMR